jgi:AraC-like DNA-binding protein
MPTRPTGDDNVNEDVLSDVLRAIRLNGAVYFDFELSSPWVAEAPPSSDLAPLVMPGADRLIEYHLVARGSCWANTVGGEPALLREGDIIVFPQGDPHVLSSAPGMRGDPDMSAYLRREGPLPLVFDAGGGGNERARVVCGFLGCDDRPFNPLLASLPREIRLPATGQSSTGLLRLLVETAVGEARNQRPGAANMLGRLAELMFVEVVRRHLETVPPGQSGWLAGLRDPVVGRALAALHRAPARAWTIEALGRDVGVSRSVLAERFTELVGQPPIHYLACWRMQLASGLIAEGGHVADVADAVGYRSEAAFSRTFKKIVGMPPGEWREHRKRPSPGR